MPMIPRDAGGDGRLVRGGGQAGSPPAATSGVGLVAAGDDRPRLDDHRGQLGEHRWDLVPSPVHDRSRRRAASFGQLVSTSSSPASGWRRSGSASGGARGRPSNWRLRSGGSPWLADDLLLGLRPPPGRHTQLQIHRPGMAWCRWRSRPRWCSGCRCRRAETAGGAGRVSEAPCARGARRRRVRRGAVRTGGRRPGAWGRRRSSRRRAVERRRVVRMVEGAGGLRTAGRGRPGRPPGPQPPTGENLNLETGPAGTD